MDTSTQPGGDEAVAPADYWEDRYAGKPQMWSGKVNQVFAEVVAELEPGTALDLGCGEGADVLWLAEHGWSATGIDISATAIARARTAAADRGLGDSASFQMLDLHELSGAERYDLVTASFLHSPVELHRIEVLRAAAERVAPGGHLFVLSHIEFPPWSAAHHERRHELLPPEEELALLALPADQWSTVIAETRPRAATAPDGTTATIHDSVILLRRQTTG